HGVGVVPPPAPAVGIPLPPGVVGGAAHCAMTATSAVPTSFTRIRAIPYGHFGSEKNVAFGGLETEQSNLGSSRQGFSPGSQRWNGPSGPVSAPGLWRSTTLGAHAESTVAAVNSINRPGRIPESIICLSPDPALIPKMARHPPVPQK